MQKEFILEDLERADPFALNPLVEDRSTYFVSKRVLDLALTIAALVILLPVLIPIAILIWLDSPGPVFFVQERVGARRHARGGLACWEKVTFPFVFGERGWGGERPRRGGACLLAKSDIPVCQVSHDGPQCRSLLAPGIHQ